MREIKFRMWFKPEGVMVFLPIMDICSEYSELAFSAPEDSPFYGIDSLPDAYQGGEKIENYEIMQYTGLKDSTKWEQLTPQEQGNWVKSGHKIDEWNGKEIYEGDIVTPSLRGLESKGEIRWSNIWNGWVAMVHKYGKMEPFPISIDASKLPLQVIGNIYENPELLEVKNG